MTRWSVLALIILGLTSAAAAQSNLYKMRNGAVITQMGAELIQSTNLMCTEFMRLQGHFAAMTQQRDSTEDYSTVAAQWGFLDPSTNAVSEPVAEAAYTELNSVIGNTQAAILQWCARIRQ